MAPWIIRTRPIKKYDLIVNGYLLFGYYMYMLKFLYQISTTYTLTAISISIMILLLYTLSDIFFWLLLRYGKRFILNLYLEYPKMSYHKEMPVFTFITVNWYLYCKNMDT